MTSINRILRIDASARHAGSVTRNLADETLGRLAELEAVKVTIRDVAAGLPFVDEDWVPILRPSKSARQHIRPSWLFPTLS
jgi:FMN-dependent NADH-azoreductase